MLNHPKSVLANMFGGPQGQVNMPSPETMLGQISPDRAARMPRAPAGGSYSMPSPETMLGQIAPDRAAQMPRAPVSSGGPNLPEVGSLLESLTGGGRPPKTGGVPPRPAPRPRGLPSFPGLPGLPSGFGF